MTSRVSISKGPRKAGSASRPPGVALASGNGAKRPGTPTGDNQAFRGLLTAYGLISRVMYPHFAAVGISGAKWGVLRTLQRAEAEGVHELRLADLGDRLLVRPPSVTTIVNRLRDDGWVSIKQSASDQRVKLIRLAPAGRRALRRGLQGHPEKVAGLMSALSACEQRKMAMMLAKLNAHLRDEIDKRRSQPGEGDRNGARH